VAELPLSGFHAEDYSVRVATLDDLPVLVAHRLRLFTEMHQHSDAAALAALEDEFKDWVYEHLQDGTYHGWFAVTPTGAIAASAGLWILEWPPTLISPQPRRGFILNVYTEAAHRKKGLATLLTRYCIAEAKARRLRIVLLHASPEGQHVYEKMGFRPTNEMRLILD
jgi:ribosomal protein S18 acetylase RimI-like enzyme